MHSPADIPSNRRSRVSGASGRDFLCAARLLGKPDPPEDRKRADEADEAVIVEGLAMPYEEALAYAVNGAPWSRRLAVPAAAAGRLLRSSRLLVRG